MNDLDPVPSVLLLLKNQKRFHTEFQMECFITGQSGSGHLYGMLTQALRELDTRFWSLIQLATNESDVKDPFKHLRNTFSWKDRVREFAYFYAQVVALRKLVPLETEEEVRHAEESLWLHKLKVIGAIDLLTTGRLSRTLFEVIPTLPENMRLEMMRMYTDPGQWMDWYQGMMARGNQTYVLGPVPTLEEAEALLVRSYEHVLEALSGDSGPGPLRLPAPPCGVLEDRLHEDLPSRSVLDGSPARADPSGREYVLPGIRGGDLSAP